MEEQSLIKTSDRNPVDMQGGIPELSGKLEDDSKASEEMDATIRRQRKHILNLQEQLHEYRLTLDLCCQDLKRWMDIEQLEGSLKGITPLYRFGGPLVDQPISEEEDMGTVPHSYVEISDVEEEQIAPEVEEDKEQDVDVQTKSWWRRQAKMVKGLGTFRLRLKHCLGVKTSEKTVARLFIVQPVNSAIVTMDNVMPPVSVAMPPVSV